MSIRLKHLCQKISAFLFPPKCPACGAVTGSANEGELCGNCLSAFAEDFVSLCPACGNTPEYCVCVPDIAGNEWDRSPYTTVMPLIFAGFYTGYRDDSVVSAMVYRMKRHRSPAPKLFFARIIAEKAVRELTLANVEISTLTVTYIPRTDSAFAEYGFDHMETVAKRVAEMLGCRSACLLKRSGGVAQKELGGEGRKANAYNSIMIDPAKTDLIRNGRILLLDDVVTSGSTMRAAVSRLSLAGADTVIPAAAMLSVRKNGGRSSDAVGTRSGMGSR